MMVIIEVMKDNEAHSEYNLKVELVRYAGGFSKKK
jgi:hypothetical protein